MVENRWRDSQAWCVMRWSRMHEEMANNVQWDTLSFSAVQYQKSIHTISDILNGISANQRSALLLDIWLYLATYSRPSHHTFSTISSPILNRIYIPVNYCQSCRTFCAFIVSVTDMNECNLLIENSREFSREMRNDFSRFSQEFSRMRILIGNPRANSP